MSTSRLFTAAVAAFMLAAVSFDPRSSALPRQHAPLVTAEATQPALPEIEPAAEPAPPDVQVEVAPDGPGAHRVIVRRRGFLVSLRHEDARAAGLDWTAIRVSPQAGPGGAAGRLIWETTRPDGLSTERGLVLLAGSGAALAGDLRAAAPPRPAASWKSPHATCAGQRDGLGGFTVLCRFPRGVRVSGVANVTGARSLDDAWLVPGPSPLVRLDLPRSPGSAEGHVVGLVKGVTGVELRVEATFFAGEEAALVFHESARAQPVGAF